ncbi:RNA-binding protein 4B-like isoform X2 [Mixophyes fleayi]|uniref:RNA-binding protein 4B-like isoform X2 n=1 Tax=Mixophyes fleayi TaxID=3061075 RepID=UPI003F4DFC7B
MSGGHVGAGLFLSWAAQCRQLVAILCSSRVEKKLFKMVKLFVGNLPPEATQGELKSLFEQFGKVTECDIITNYGFVHMEDKKSADEAVHNLNHYKLHGVSINVEHSRGKPKASTKLHVSSISTDVTSDELREKFEEYGSVLECDIVKDYAFVHMEKAEEALEAIRNLNNFDFKGKIFSGSGAVFVRVCNKNFTSVLQNHSTSQNFIFYFKKDNNPNEIYIGGCGIVNMSFSPHVIAGWYKQIYSKRFPVMLDQWAIK